MATKQDTELEDIKTAEEEIEEQTAVEESEQEEVVEETAAAATLKPGAKSVSDPKSKIGIIQTVLGQMSSMSKDDLNGWYKTISQYGPGKDYGVGDNSAKNSATIDTKLGKGPKTKDGMPKLNVKEDVEAMFEGQDLSEEFKESASTLFEAAVSARVIAETARLEEEYETKLNEEITAFTEEVNTKLDAYLDYAVEHWMRENEVAIESTLQTELTREFMLGLKNLFAEHYISVPAEEVNVVETLADKVSELETRLNESISENVELKNAILETQREGIFEELASDLALTQQEKFAALAEGIEFDGNLETYEKKLKIVKENYFKSDVVTTSTNLEEETFEGEVTTNVSVDPTVNRYVQAIAKTVKK